MKIATVTITRLGNKYLQEYVEYYKNLGVDKMYFYDNNQEGEEKVDGVLSNYISDGFVEVIPFETYYDELQKVAYQDFYDKHGSEYDWIGYFDDDEYITINTGEDLKTFLSNPIFEGRNGVSFPMINYCDSGVIVNDKSTRLDVYTEMNVFGPLNRSFYKTMVRGGIDCDYILEDRTNETVHVPFVNKKDYYNFVDCDGNPLEGKAKRYWTYYGTNDAFLKHIPTGCIDDYINMKMKRDWPDTNNKQNFGYDYFKTINVDTEEKYKYFLEHTK